MEKKRIAWMDVAKGILIILVVVGHIKSSYSSSGLLTESFLLNFSNAFAYSFHMAAFFFLSGCLSHSKKPCREQIVSSLISYGIPYVIFSLVHWVLQLVFSSLSNHSIDPLDILKIAVFPFTSLWFIYALMSMKMLNALCRNMKYRKAITLCSAVIIFVVNAFMEGLLRETWYADSILCDFASFYIYFVIGVEFGESICTAISKIPIKGILSVVMVAVVAVAAYFKMLYDVNVYLGFFLAIIGILMIVFVSQSIAQSRVLQYLGNNSMPIYLLHGSFIAFFRIAMTKLGVPVTNSGWVQFLVCTTMAILLPLLCLVIAQKIPYLDFVFSPRKYLNKHLRGARNESGEN